MKCRAHNAGRVLLRLYKPAARAAFHGLSWVALHNPLPANFGLQTVPFRPLRRAASWRSVLSNMDRAGLLPLPDPTAISKSDQRYAARPAKRATPRTALEGRFHALQERQDGARRSGGGMPVSRCPGDRAERRPDYVRVLRPGDRRVDAERL
jgi:hypothetical protein